MPDRLPTAEDFDTRARDLQARYEEAWLACRIIAERLGERRARWLCTEPRAVASRWTMRCAGPVWRRTVSRALWRGRLEALAA